MPNFRYSLKHDPQSSGVNALTMNWSPIYRYAYPPIALIPRVLRKLQRHPTAIIILIALFWPSQIWFRPLTQLLVDIPRKLSDVWNLLRNSETNEFFPEPAKMWVVAWRLSASPSARKDFLHKLQTLPPADDENRPEGFTIPVSPTSPDGVLREKWIPTPPL